nr:hypothetical protein [Tanacetum cinerariifolium]
MQMIGGNGGNQFRQYAGNLNGYNAVQNVGNQAKEKGCCLSSDTVVVTQKKEAEIKLQAEEYDLMAAAADLDEIEEVNANCILMANLQQASSSGTQTDSTPVYDSDGSAEPEWSQHVTIVHQTKDLHTADYTQLYNFMKYNQKEVDELKAERIAKIQDPLALMANFNNPYASPAPYQDLSLFNQNYLQQPMPNPKDITDSTTAMNLALSLMAKAFKLNYSTLTNNN